MLILIKNSYLAMIKNSVGTKMFRSIFALADGKKKDILRNGELSCAYFVSSLLLTFGLIKEIHATVSGTIYDLEQSGWQRVNSPKEGSIIIWQSKKFKDGETHRHIGFYLGKNKSVSTSAEKKMVANHHPTYKNKRGIEAIFWHQKLD